MKKIKQLNDDYSGFFKIMNSFAHSPLSKTAKAIFKKSNVDFDFGATGMIVTAGAMLILSPILLPLTAISAAIALMLVVLAALTTVITYPVAAIMDCCDSEDSSLRNASI